MATISPYEELQYHGTVRIKLEANWEARAAHALDTLKFCTGEPLEARKASRIVSDIHNSEYNPRPGNHRH